jgi:threonylcarbamoyladenosine tRNA methylthiotransferase MtaB
MPAVPMQVRRERAARLREVGTAAASRFHDAQIGATAQVLTEVAGAGHTEHFAPVRLAADTPPATLIRARITGADSRGLLAEAA